MEKYRWTTLRRLQKQCHPIVRCTKRKLYKYTLYRNIRHGLRPFSHEKNSSRNFLLSNQNVKQKTTIGKTLIEPMHFTENIALFSIYGHNQVPEIKVA